MSASKAKSFESAAEEFPAAVAKGIDATVSTLKDNIDKATAGFQETQAKVKENVEKAVQTAEDFVSFSQGNFEAVVKSSQIWAAGVQDLGKTLVVSAKEQMDDAVAAVNSFAAAKSFNDLLDLQAAFARSSLDKAITETSKLTDASTRLATDVLAPLTARVTLAAETFGRTV